MELGMSLNTLLRPPLSSSSSTFHSSSSSFNHSLFSIPKQFPTKSQHHNNHHVLVVEAKGRSRRVQRIEPALPKIEDDGNPKFALFIRMADFYSWYPLSVVSGGTAAKIILAAKDNFLGKYIYKDTLARNLASVIYRDEKEIKKIILKHPDLKYGTEFRYGYKLLVNGNVKNALSPRGVIELPKKDELTNVVDKVKDFFGDVKDTFVQITSLDTTTTEEPEENTKAKSKSKVKGR